MLDSGLGGLTVLAALRATIGGVDVQYFADTANVPYGDRSLADVAALGYAAVEHLLKAQPSLIVAASGTTCAAFEAHGWPRADVPLFGVVTPGAAAAIDLTRNGRIGVVATQATVDSGIFERTIVALAPGARVCSVAAPTLVPIVESGRWASAVARTAVAGACRPLARAGCDTVILGCTHFPHLRKWFEAALQTGVELVDPGFACATAAAELLRPMRAATGRTAFLVSGGAQEFARNAHALMEIRIDGLRHIQLSGRLKASGTA